MVEKLVEFFVSWFIYPNVSMTAMLLGIGLAIVFGAIWFTAYWTPILKKPWAWAVLVSSAILALAAVSFMKIPTEYPPACWRDESGSPKGEAKVLAVNGRILV